MLINRLEFRSGYLIKILVSLMLLAGWITAGAQQPDSLPGFLKEAAINNPGLKAKYSAYLAALEKVPQAGALPDPEVQFGFFIKPMELMEGYQLADFRLMQMSPWFGALKAAKDEASKMALSRYEEVQSSRNEIFLKVKSSWYQLYRTKKEIELTEKNLSILRSLERMALIRFKVAGNATSAGAGAGAGTEADAGARTGARTGANGSGSGMTGGSMGGSSADKSGSMASSGNASMGSTSQGGMVNLIRVRIEIGDLENRLVSLKDQLLTEKIRFNSNLNRKPDTEVFVNDSLPEAVLPASLILLADSIANNPMIRMYEADQAANEAKITMAARMGYPMIGIGLDYSLIRKFPDVTSPMNGKDMVMPMITATLPIYRKKYRALRQEAGFLRDASIESAKNVRNELTVNYQEALQLYNDAGRRAELFNRQASLAEKTITLLTASFSAAGTDFEEILRMQQQLLDYQFKKIEALVDRNLAIAGLMSIIAYN